jgi:hypothetical protein
VAGAKTTRHSGRTLFEHLLGTMAYLEAYGVEPDVCLAGALHSVYSTNSFRKVTIPSHFRHVVRKAVGERPERLAFIFSQIDRPKALENPLWSDRAGFVWLTERKDVEGGSLEVSVQELIDLRLIEAANLLEQGSSLTKYPRIETIWLGQIGAQMREG